MTVTLRGKDKNKTKSKSVATIPVNSKIYYSKHWKSSSELSTFIRSTDIIKFFTNFHILTVLLHSLCNSFIKQYVGTVGGLEIRTGQQN